jgi:hypothetical protein
VIEETARCCAPFFFGGADCDGDEAQRVSADKEEIPPRWRPIGANQFLGCRRRSTHGAGRIDQHLPRRRALYFFDVRASGPKRPARFVGNTASEEREQRQRDEQAIDKER